MISLMSLMLCRSQYSFIKSMILSVTVGSMKLAVPTCIAEAPANMNSIASRPFMIPPNPITGMLTALATCHTILTAIGRTAAPDSPPVIVDR